MFEKKAKPAKVTSVVPVLPVVTPTKTFPTALRDALKERVSPRYDNPMLYKHGQYGGDYDDSLDAMRYSMKQSQYGYAYGSGGYSSYDDARRKIEDQMRHAMQIIEQHVANLGSPPTTSDLPKTVGKIFQAALDSEHKIKNSDALARRANHRADMLQEQINIFTTGPTTVMTTEKHVGFLVKADEWCKSQKLDYRLVLDGGHFAMPSLTSVSVNATAYFVFEDKKTAATFKLLFA